MARRANALGIVPIAVCACGRIGFDPISDGSFDPTGDGAGSGTLVFRDGYEGYTGTVDTYLDLANPDADHHMDPALHWLDAPAMPAQQHALVFFEMFFGPRTIPAGAVIRSATLKLFVSDACVAPAGTVAEIAIDWGSTINWTTFGADPGVQPADVRGLALPAPTGTGVYVIDVAASVRAWALDPTRNNGWIISPAGSNSDACAVVSSEGADPLQRPELTIEIDPP
jgi:hypothetical protein